MYIQEGVARTMEALQESIERVTLNYDYYTTGVYEPSRANPLLTADDKPYSLIKIHKYQYT